MQRSIQAEYSEASGPTIVKHLSFHCYVLKKWALRKPTSRVSKEAVTEGQALQKITARRKEVNTHSQTKQNKGKLQQKVSLRIYISYLGVKKKQTTPSLLMLTAVNNIWNIGNSKLNLWFYFDASHLKWLKQLFQIYLHCKSQLYSNDVAITSSCVIYRILEAQRHLNT